MSKVRRNVVANFAGQLWSALMGVLFIPVYIHLLGLESFGLVGFFVTVQAFAVVLDLGLAGTINRELARSGGVEPQSTRDLVRTLEWIYWPLGAGVALLIWAGSGWLAESWLRPVDLPVAGVGLAIALMGAAIGGQWPSAFYSAGLNGLQRQILVNGLIACFGTLRGAGVLLPLLLVSPTVEVFFGWQAVVGLLQSTVLAVVLWRALPVGTRAARFAVSELSRVGAFTFGLTGIALLSFVLIQIDRIILSRLLPLDQFGVYSLAASVAAVILRLVQPWFNAVYPRFAELHAAGNERSLRSLYHSCSQWLAVTLLPAAIVMAVFAPELLRIWTRDPNLADSAGPILTILVLGTAMNGLMNLPYAVQLAYGWTALALWANVVGVLVVVPGVWLLAKAYGSLGAATMWLVLNLGYLAVALPLMHRRLLRGELANWYFRDIGPVAAASACVALGLKAILPEHAVGLVGLGVIGMVVAGGALLASPIPSAALRNAMRVKFSGPRR